MAQTMDDDTFRALAQVIEHYYNDALWDWEAAGKPEDHIFISMDALADWAKEVSERYFAELDQKSKPAQSNRTPKVRWVSGNLDDDLFPELSREWGMHDAEAELSVFFADEAAYRARTPHKARLDIKFGYFDYGEDGHLHHRRDNEATWDLDTPEDLEWVAGVMRDAAGPNGPWHVLHDQNDIEYRVDDDGSGEPCWWDEYHCRDTPFVVEHIYPQVDGRPIEECLTHFVDASAPIPIR